MWLTCSLDKTIQNSPQPRRRARTCKKTTCSTDGAAAAGSSCFGTPTLRTSGIDHEYRREIGTHREHAHHAGRTAAGPRMVHDRAVRGAGRESVFYLPGIGAAGPD